MLIKKILVPLYFMLYKINFLLYKINFLPIYKTKNLYIISIGNLAVGGAGKTPFVALVSSCLSQQNIQHCIVSRGYKKKLLGEQYINNSNINSFTPEQIGDEPYMLVKSLKNSSIIVGNKKRALQLAESKKMFSHIIIDDGFQTHSVEKNYNILLIDCSVPLNKYKLLPLGLLREPLTAIKRANLVVFTKTNLCSAEKLTQKKKEFLKYVNETKQRVLNASLSIKVFIAQKNKLIAFDVGKLHDLVFVGFSGIANPLSFEKAQKKLSIKCIKNFIFPDHYSYSQNSINKMILYAKQKKVSSLLTTKKDFYKIVSLFPEDFSVFVLDVEHVLHEKINLIDLFN